MGMIADGDVDERDIRDILPSELAGYTQCHFFAGIGVWSYALRMAGWPDDRPVWTASPPCQPFSAAGRGGGVADERHLFPHLHHLIRVQRPPNFFGEQVASKDGLGWLDLVQADMEAEDYSGGAFDLCAAGVGAPHIRQRLSLVFRDARIAWASYAARCGWREERQDSRGCGSRDCPQGWAAGHSSSTVVELGDCRCSGLERLGGHGDDAGGRAFARGPASPSGADGTLERPLGERCEGERLLQERRHANSQTARFGEVVELADGVRDRTGPATGNRDGAEATALGIDGSSSRSSAPARIGGSSVQLVNPNGRDASAEREQRGGEHGLEPEDGCLGRRPGGAERGSEIQLVGLADDDDERRERGRAGQESDGRDPSWLEPQRLCDAGVQPGRPGPVNSGWANADWLFCRDGKWRPVESGTFPLVDGSAFRMDSGGPFAGKSRGKMLEGAGNAIVSEQQAHVIAAYLEHEADEIAAFHAAGSGLHLIEDLL
ncbi:MULTISPECIES: DNA cytosine methyltransferase [unclassified Sphingopyxis]|uniref:DNA cytosine methyltransferase n=1 Tax=unclassified Sphingopyxis TaxID=2614943 RepID=UPI00386D2F47